MKFKQKDLDKWVAIKNEKVIASHKDLGILLAQMHDRKEKDFTKIKFSYMPSGYICL